MSSTSSIQGISILAVNAIDEVMFLALRVFYNIAREVAICGNHPSSDSDPLWHCVLVHLGGWFTATVRRHAPLVNIVIVT